MTPFEFLVVMIICLPITIWLYKDDKEDKT